MFSLVSSIFNSRSSRPCSLGGRPRLSHSSRHWRVKKIKQKARQSIWKLSISERLAPQVISLSCSGWCSCVPGQLWWPISWPPCSDCAPPSSPSPTPADDSDREMKRNKVWHEDCLPVCTTDRKRDARGYCCPTAKTPGDRTRECGNGSCGNRRRSGAGSH